MTRCELCGRRLRVTSTPELAAISHRVNGDCLATPKPRRPKPFALNKRLADADAIDPAPVVAPVAAGSIPAPGRKKRDRAYKPRPPQSGPLPGGRRPCAICGTPFLPIGWRGLYCGDGCKSIAANKRRKARGRAS